MKYRSILWIVIFISVLCCLMNILHWREAKIEKKKHILSQQTTGVCAYQENFVAAHRSTLRAWRALFQRQYSMNIDLSFGVEASAIDSCQVVMSNVTIPTIQGSLKAFPFDRWSYSYQIVSRALVIRTIDERCRFLTNDNVFVCIDFISAVTREVEKQALKGVVVWVMPDLITSQGATLGTSFELQYLFHSLVIRYVMGAGTVVIMNTKTESQSSSLCKVLSALSYNYDSAIPIQSAVQIAHEAVVSLRRSCKPSTPSSLHDLCFKHIHSRKYEPRCFPSLEQYSEVINVMTSKVAASVGGTPAMVTGVYPMLITGLGGSGTHNIANLLNEIGVDIAHEDVASFGAVSWLYAANDWSLRSPYPYGALHSSSLVPYSGLLVPRFQHVLHVVRHPLRQIASVTSHSNMTYDFILWFVENSVKDATVVEKFKKAHELQSSCFRGGSCHLYFSALAWVYWNRHVRSYADGTYLVEDPLSLFRAVCSLVHSDSTAEAKLCVDRAVSLSDKGMYSNQDSNGGWWSRLWSKRHYHSSRAHKNHQTYTLKDISRIDVDLADKITHDMVKYGQNNLQATR